jgi:hypothetical protein
MKLFLTKEERLTLYNLFVWLYIGSMSGSTFFRDVIYGLWMQSSGGGWTGYQQPKTRVASGLLDDYMMHRHPVFLFFVG